MLISWMLLYYFDPHYKLTITTNCPYVGNFFTITTNCPSLETDHNYKLCSYLSSVIIILTITTN
uniref:Uncharacterized protein n=1 Tax=Arion vulgaris TaxID=1028688 RepID=A0A0B7AJ35_9EUPU